MAQSRNKTVIWVIILIALILGVLLIPIPKGSVARTLLFSDYFNENTVDENKWNYDQTMKYNITDEGLNFIWKDKYSHGYDMNMKNSYESDVFVYNIDFNAKRGVEDFHSFFIRSTSMSLNNNSNLFNYISVSLVGYTHGNFGISYVTDDLKSNFTSSYAQWFNNTWYRLVITMDLPNDAFSVWIGQWTGAWDVEGGTVTTNKVYAKIYEESFDNWFTKDEPIYAGLHAGTIVGVVNGNSNTVFSPQLPPPVTIPPVTLQIDNVELWSEGKKTPSLNLFLLWLAILSTLLIIYGSVINANCKQYHILATCLGVLGFSMIAGLLLNNWLYATWALITSMIAIWSMIVLTTHENWAVDYQYYEQVGTTAMIIGITFTIITFIEYITLIMTNYYTPFWW